jgi:hypothetical protein
LIGCEHQTARGYDDIEGAVWEWKIFCIPYFPGDVTILFFRSALLRDGEEFGGEVQSRDRSAARPRHERCVPGSASKVEHLLAGADAPAPHDMVCDRLDALGDPVVVAGCPSGLMFLPQLRIHFFISILVSYYCFS